MELSLTFFLFAVPAVLFAGMSKGGFGSLASFAAAPILALILSPGAAIGLMLPLLMAMDVTAVPVYWRKWNWPVARALILGAIPGVLLGWLVYDQVDPAVFKLLIGIIAIGFVLFQLAKERGILRPPSRALGPIAGSMWGTATGLTSFISHAGGPPAAIYMLSQRMDKTTFQATSVLVFWSVNLLKLPAYLAAGIFSRETLLADLYLLPVAVLGVLLGAWLHHRMPERLFFIVTYIFLTVTGAKLIWDALGAI